MAKDFESLLRMLGHWLGRRLVARTQESAGWTPNGVERLVSTMPSASPSAAALQCVGMRLHRMAEDIGANR